MKGHQKHWVKCLYHKAARLCGFISFIQVAATTSRQNESATGLKMWHFHHSSLEKASSVLLSFLLSLEAEEASLMSLTQRQGYNLL